MPGTIISLVTEYLSCQYPQYILCSYCQSLNFIAAVFCAAVSEAHAYYALAAAAERLVRATAHALVCDYAHSNVSKKLAS